jgi:hypothetical protein
MDWLGRAVFETFPGFLDGSFFLSGELGGALTAMDTKIYERRFTSDSVQSQYPGEFDHGQATPKVKESQSRTASSQQQGSQSQAPQGTDLRRTLW